MGSQQSESFVQAIHLGKRVTTSEGPLTILDDINFSIPTGTSVAILGASGSGKTTLLGLLAGLDVPTEGQAIINGQDLGAMDEDGRALLRADSVGFVFQNFQLLNGLTALENVMLPLELAGATNPRLLASDLLDRVGLRERMTIIPINCPAVNNNAAPLRVPLRPNPNYCLPMNPPATWINKPANASSICCLLSIASRAPP